MFESVSVIPIVGPIKVVLSSQPIVFPDSVSSRVDSLWNDLMVGSKKLTSFDGDILCVLSLSGSEILCGIAKYRYYYAQSVDRAVGDLGLEALAVSGLTFVNGSVLVARRPANVLQYPGFLELVPSGAVDTSFVFGNRQECLSQQIIRELHEEIGPLEVKSVEPKLLVRDRVSRVLDVVLELQVNEFKKSFRESSEKDRIINSNVDRYDKSLLVSVKDLKYLTRKWASRWFQHRSP